MVEKEQRGLHENSQVKQHYEHAAKSRNQRLLSPHLNVAQVNHRVRFRIIDSLLKEIGCVEHGIDIGTGTGVWAEILTRCCATVKGIDFADKNIEIAQNNAAERNLTDCLSYVLGDAQHLEGLADNSFDIATHISVLQHLPDPLQALKRVGDILQPNGHLILLVHNSRCIYNRNRIYQRRHGTMLEINEYETLGGIIKKLRAAGLCIQKVRLCWLFIFDLLMIGSANPYLKLLSPIRKALLIICEEVGSILGRFRCLAPLFREIVILARKQ
ncbi:MAG: class I SAM-dependent methyltransferase [Chloroflexi bacterium]|nr:class I SAM-dependent methyltransferase [Chloroflexota bacterium]